MVKRPDLLWMFHRKDLFVSLDGFEFEDGRVVLSDDSKTRDKAACKAIDVCLDDCVIWGGMPVVTESGATLGTVGVVTFSLMTGKVDSFLVDTGATANALLGTRSVPGDLVLGFRRGIGCALAGEYEGSDENPVLGAILVKDEAANIAIEGGAAEKAGAATAVAMDKAHTAVDKVKPKVSEAAHVAGDAVNKGAYATGKQIGKATGMFSDFKEEYDKTTADRKKDRRSFFDALNERLQRSGKTFGHGGKAVRVGNGRRLAVAVLNQVLHKAILAYFSRQVHNGQHRHIQGRYQQQRLFRHVPADGNGGQQTGPNQQHANADA